MPTNISKLTHTDGTDSATSSHDTSSRSSSDVDGRSGKRRPSPKESKYPKSPVRYDFMLIWRMDTAEDKVDSDQAAAVSTETDTGYESSDSESGTPPKVRRRQRRKSHAQDSDTGDNVNNVNTVNNVNSVNSTNNDYEDSRHTRSGDDDSDDFDESDSASQTSSRSASKSSHSSSTDSDNRSDYRRRGPSSSGSASEHNSDKDKQLTTPRGNEGISPRHDKPNINARADVDNLTDNSAPTTTPTKKTNDTNESNDTETGTGTETTVIAGINAGVVGSAASGTGKDKNSLYYSDSSMAEVFGDDKLREPETAYPEVRCNALF